MIIKTAIFYTGCALAWFVLLPVFIVGGGLALLGYAIFAELGTTVVGPDKESSDESAARETARRMCLGS